MQAFNDFTESGQVESRPLRFVFTWIGGLFMDG